MSSLEGSTSSPLHSSWMQSLLMVALEKEPLMKTVSLCYQLLLYLRSLKAKLVIIANPAELGRLQSATEMCFQLLQYLLRRLLELRRNVSKDETNSDEEVQYGGHKYVDHVEDTCCTVLHHPVILSCFLWKPQHLSGSCHVSQDGGSELTYNVVNLLLAVLPNMLLPQKKILMAPFVSKICSDGMMEIQTAQDGTGNIYLKKSDHTYVGAMVTINQYPAVNFDKINNCCETISAPSF